MASRYLSLTLIASLALLAPPVSADAPPVPVGVILPLSGDLAKFSLKVQRGMQLALETDSPLRLIYEDGELSKAKALSAYHKLTTVDGVKLIIGPFGPDQTLTLAPRADKNGVLLVAVSLCDSRFISHPTVFCIYPSQEEQMLPVMKHFEKERGLRGARIGLMFEDVQAASPFAPYFQGFAERTSSQLVGREMFLSDQTDFRVNLLRLRERGVDLFAVGAMNPYTAIRILRQARDLGFEPAYRWYLTELDRGIFKKEHALLEGVYTAAVPVLRPEFIADYKQKFGEDPDLYHAVGHDAAAALALAVKRAGTDIKRVSAELIAAAPGRPAIAGFKFNTNRAISAPMAATVIRAGAQVHLLPTRP